MAVMERSGIPFAAAGGGPAFFFLSSLDFVLAFSSFTALSKVAVVLASPSPLRNDVRVAGRRRPVSTDGSEKCECPLIRCLK